MEVKVLGTVSPRCYENKNCPGFLVSDQDNLLLLDCGNGVSKYLKSSDMSKLTIIISHLHHDHYGDLLSLAYDSYVLHNVGLLQDKIPVYIPKPDLKSPDSVENNLNVYNFLTNLGEESYLEFHFYDETTKLEIGNFDIEFSRNPHQVPTYSTKVNCDNQTLVYSGDTGYQNNTLVTLAENANLLICEATYLKGQTRKKDYHLYAEEAAQIATLANVEKLLLTHFYPELDKSLYVAEAKEIFSNIEAAEEGKVLKIGGKR